MITRREAIKLGTVAAVASTVKLPAQAASTPPDACFLPARDMAAMIRAKKISSRELMEAHLKQIARVNPKVNAIVTLVPEDQLLAQAKAADEATARGEFKGPLHGLPIAAKDLVDTKGNTLTNAALQFNATQRLVATAAAGGSGALNTATVTGRVPGLTAIVPSCTPPGCNANLPPQ